MQSKAAATIENWLPLEPLIVILKKSGFVITPSTYVQFKDLTESYPLNKLRENNYQLLADLLCPIVTQNKDQQLRFKIIFENYVAYQRLMDFPKRPQLTEVERLKQFIKKYKYIFIVLLALVIAVLVWWHLFPRAEKILIIDYSGQTKFQEKDSIIFNAQNFFSDATHDLSEFNFTWSFGDGGNNKVGEQVLHTYTHSGIYNLDVHIQSDKYKTDTIVITPVTIVKGIIEVNLQTRKDLSAIKQGDAITFSALIQDKRKVSTAYQWSVNDSIVSKSYKPLTYFFNDTGFYNVRFTAIADSLNSATTQWDEEGFAVDQKSNVVKYSIASIGKQLVQSYQINDKWFYALFIALVFCFAMYRDSAKRLKECVAAIDALRKKIQEAIEIALASRFKKINVPYEYNNKKPPFEISFASQDHLVKYSPGFDKLVQNLRNRVHDESHVLRIKKTVQATVRKSGFVDLVYDQKSKPREYLILIEKQFDNSQQTKLFSNLANYYADENVFSEKFFFDVTLDAIYREYDPAHVVELSELKRKFPEHVTIIIGDGYGMLDETESLPHESILYQWQKLVLLTPVPVTDWGYREKTLQQKFLLLPVDLQGQRVLLDAIEASNFKAEQRLSPDAKSYSIKYVDFTNILELEEYLTTAEHGDLLFQWLCGIAVYPKIKWEVILAVGNALLGHHGKLHLLSFDSLLRLARITWLHEGRYAGYIRYHLLKKLKRENEFIARQAVIDLLQRSSAQADSFAFEEWDVQLKTNEAILYASNPEAYRLYEKAFEDIKKLWSNKLITDLHLVQNFTEESVDSYRYEQGNNQFKESSVATDTMAQLFTDKVEGITERERKQKEEEIRSQFEREKQQLERKKKNYLFTRNAFITCIVILIVWAAIVIAFKNSFVNTSLNDLTKIVVPNEKIENDITIKPFFDSCFVNNYLGDSSYSAYLVVNNTDTFITAQDKDYFLFKKVKLDSLNAIAHLFFDARRKIRSDEFVIANDAFSFSAMCNTQPSLLPVDTVFIQYTNNRDKETIYTIRKYLQQLGYVVLAPYWRSQNNSRNEIRYSEVPQKQKADSLAKALAELIDIDTVLLATDNSTKYPLQLWVNNNELSISEQCEEVDNTELTKFEGMWRDNKNRVIRFYMQGNQVYYSTGNEKSYSTYYIVRVCKADSSYVRFITRAKYGYKVFFVNVVNTAVGSSGATRPRLQMRLCDAVQASSEADAEKITVSQCPAVSLLNKVSDRGLALNQIVYNYDKLNYATFDQRKLDSIINFLQRSNDYEVTLTPYIALRGNNASSTTLAMRGIEQLRKYLISQKIRSSQIKIGSVNVLPFNRDYILYKLINGGYTDDPLPNSVIDNRTVASVKPTTAKPPVEPTINVDLSKWRKEFEEIQSDINAVIFAKEPDKKVMRKYKAKSESDFSYSAINKLEKIKAGINNAFQKQNASSVGTDEQKKLLNEINSLINTLTPKRNTKN